MSDSDDMRTFLWLTRDEWLLIGCLALVTWMICLSVLG